MKPLPPQLATGFHGGGGGSKVGEEWTPTGCMCGALAAGVLVIGALYGRTSPKQSKYGCAAHLSGYLHKRFEEELGAKCCSMLRPFYKKIDPDNSCNAIYKKGAELAVEVVFSAPQIHAECQMPKSLKNLLT